MALKGLTALQQLDLWGTPVSDLEPPKGLTALSSVLISPIPQDKRWHLIGRQGEAAILGRPDPVRQMLWSEIMSSRYVRNHRTRRDRLGNDPPLLLIAPPSAADRARYLRAALNNLRVVTNVDHNVHTIVYPKIIAIVHHSHSLSYVG